MKFIEGRFDIYWGGKVKEKRAQVITLNILHITISSCFTIDEEERAPGPNRLHNDWHSVLQAENETGCLILQIHDALVTVSSSSSIHLSTSEHEPNHQ